jgi:hypothetical protein
MRLLRLQDDGSYSLTEFIHSIPAYAILSHIWVNDEDEVSYWDVIQGTGSGKAGYAKLRFCAERAACHGLEYMWIDTCCINKSSSAELSEAINSMFSWYYRADRCYVYLSDVTDESFSDHTAFFGRDDKGSFQKSRWFTRGWTLQELIAPRKSDFYLSDGTHIGSRDHLVQHIMEITGIPSNAIRYGCHTGLSEYSVEQRISWTMGRQTQRGEDSAYCLLGIVGVDLPLIYGRASPMHLLAYGRRSRTIRAEILVGSMYSIIAILWKRCVRA